jgi:HlyD family secretion protein
MERVGTETGAPSSADVMKAIAAGKRRGLRRFVGPGLVVVLLGALALAFFVRSQGQRQAGFELVTMPAKRGDLQAIVTATGSLRGLDTVEVGAETNGKIKAVHVDFNDAVKAGDLLLEIDPLQLTAGRNQAQAQLQAAEAELKNRKATAVEARLAADRSKQMIGGGLISSQQLEAAVAAADRAEAAIEAQSAQIVVAKAALENAQTALEKATIRSPMDGVILSRTAEVGQTVIASMQTPTLFIIAKDLKRMELTVAIDEADIGQVKEGQDATFTVDAFPGKTFSASLRLIQNTATTVDNVVTYEARLTVDNDELLLRPGMTATVMIVAAERKDALLVPNAALRFKPADESPPEVRMPLPGMGGPPRRREGSAIPSGPTVWIEKNGKPAPIKIVPGLSDGTFTEVLKGEVEPGTELITDMVQRRE